MPNPIEDKKKLFVLLTNHKPFYNYDDIPRKEDSDRENEDIFARSRIETPRIRDCKRQRERTHKVSMIQLSQIRGLWRRLTNSLNQKPKSTAKQRNTDQIR